ncbi:MAG TPA: hypothetical protein VKO42_02220, partial [Patescibacteria group bacterium]|nr:hypothetical protein [Patescibacteria group bacterium]
YCDDNVCTSVFPPGCSEEGDKRCDPDNEKKVQKCEDPDNDGVFEWVYYKDCKFGWSCDEGECSEPFCEDSDDDIDIDEKGRACYGEECCEDDCKDSNTVLECICSSKDNEPEKVEESCGDDSICDGDKCVE